MGMLLTACIFKPKVGLFYFNYTDSTAIFQTIVQKIMTEEAISKKKYIANKISKNLTLFIQ
jgi:hypothetical protein